MNLVLIIFIYAVFGITVKAQGNDSCDLGYVYHPYIHSSSKIEYLWTYEWINTTFWGGHLQIPTKENFDYKCFNDYATDLVILLDKHPDVSTLNQTAIKINACGIQRDGTCVNSNLEVYMIKCGGDLLYRLQSPNDSYRTYFYICFDRIYKDTCLESTMSRLNYTVDGSLLRFAYNYYDAFGWFNGFVDGKQYFVPTLDDKDTITQECLLADGRYYGGGFLLQELNTQQISGEDPVRFSACHIYMYEYDDNVHVDIDNEGNCYHFIYARKCNGQLQIDTTFLRHYAYNHMCLIHHNDVIVQPEIRHVEKHSYIGGSEKITEYISHLQYRCSFNMTVDTFYYVNWYINGSKLVQKGPSAVPDELVFNEDYLNNMPLGYGVECGVIVSTENISTESRSDEFYAGWKIPDKRISLAKSGYEIVVLEQTVPFGCRYNDYETAMCTVELNIYDPYSNPDVCAGKIGINDMKDLSKSFIEIKSLKKGEAWAGKQKHRAKLFTVDNDYDDKTSFDLDISLTRRDIESQNRISPEILGSLSVVVTNFDRHKNKRCYSHVDPHHKTSDGQNFEMQREGDHMMYLNEEYKTEIQQSARYCNQGRTSGPICACGIAIRVGADAFVINRCPDRDFKFDFIQCGDKGIIDLERVNDYRYLVRTPIGTVVDVSLHTWSSTMNIDIYMSAKDVGNVVGLCGQFDGDKSNDFLHRDRQTVSNDNNRSYKFSDSWKLTDEENLFENEKRKLESWNRGKPDKTCSRPDSITRKKCKLPKRKKRSLSSKHSHRLDLHAFNRAKRSEVILTEDEAFRLCNKSIYETPAVKEFPDKLAEEDPNEVVTQCVYDIIQGKDTAWVDAHTNVLNNAADTILKLNPVYVANHTETVEAFRSKTCLNNCSQNGVCTVQGECECDGNYRGPDCGIDITVPPVVYEVHGGDICHTGDGDDCSCFQVRTDNIFEGFVCEMATYKVYFNGTRVQEAHDTSQGDYIDIFTGTCCGAIDRKKRSDYQHDITITLYIFNISNDGTNYGRPNSVFVYDTTCIQQSEIDGEHHFSIKDEYCFIDNTCVLQNDKLLATDQCDLCDPNVNQFNWTKGHCDGTNDDGLNTITVVGIIVGSLVALLLISIFVCFLCVKGSKNKRSVHDSQSDLGRIISKQPAPALGRPFEDKPHAVAELKN